MTSEQRILDGSFELFKRYGIKGVTMDDIAKHLGISKKTIYQFYTDKDALVTVLIELVLNSHTERIDAIALASKNAVHEIISMMGYMATDFAGTNPNMFYDMQKYHPQAWIKFKVFKENYIYSCVIKNFEKGKEQGLYRVGLNQKILAKLRLEEVEMAFNPVIFPPDKFNLSQVQVEILDHFLHGICTIKGHKLINKYKQINEEE